MFRHSSRGRVLVSIGRATPPGKEVYRTHCIVLLPDYHHPSCGLCPLLELLARRAYSYPEGTLGTWSPLFGLANNNILKVPGLKFADPSWDHTNGYITRGCVHLCEPLAAPGNTAAKVRRR